MNKKLIILITFSLLLLLITFSSYRMLNVENKRIVCTVSYPDAYEGIYDQYSIDIIDTRNNKLTSITHIRITEAPSEKLESLYCYIKNDLNVFSNIKGVDFSIDKTENNVTFVLKEDLLKIDPKQSAETVNNSEIFHDDEVNKNTTIEEYFELYEKEYTTCEYY